MDKLNGGGKEFSAGLGIDRASLPVVVMMRDHAGGGLQLC